MTTRTTAHPEVRPAQQSWPVICVSRTSSTVAACCAAHRQQEPLTSQVLPPAVPSRGICVLLQLGPHLCLPLLPRYAGLLHTTHMHTTPAVPGIFLGLLLCDKVQPAHPHMATNNITHAAGPGHLVPHQSRPGHALVDWLTTQLPCRTCLNPSAQAHLLACKATCVHVHVHAHVDVMCWRLTVNTSCPLPPPLMRLHTATRSIFAIVASNRLS